jgi:hypothetical protein
MPDEDGEVTLGLRKLQKLKAKRRKRNRTPKSSVDGKLDRFKPSGKDL